MDLKQWCKGNFFGVPPHRPRSANYILESSSKELKHDEYTGYMCEVYRSIIKRYVSGIKLLLNISHQFDIKS